MRSRTTCKSPQLWFCKSVKTKQNIFDKIVIPKRPPWGEREKARERDRERERESERER